MTHKNLLKKWNELGVGIPTWLGAISAEEHCGIGEESQ